MNCDVWRCRTILSDKHRRLALRFPFAYLPLPHGTVGKGNDANGQTKGHEQIEMQTRENAATLEDMDAMIWEATLLHWGAFPHIPSCCRRYWWTAISVMNLGECAICLQSITSHSQATAPEDGHDGCHLSVTVLSRCCHMFHRSCLTSYLVNQGSQIQRQETRRSSVRSRGTENQVQAEPRCPVCRGPANAGDMLSFREEDVHKNRARMVAALQFALAVSCPSLFTKVMETGRNPRKDSSQAGRCALGVFSRSMWSSRGCKLIEDLVRRYWDDTSVHDLLTNLCEVD